MATRQAWAVVLAVAAILGAPGCSSEAAPPKELKIDLGGGVAVSDWTAATEGLQFRISLLNVQKFADEPLDIVVAIQNTSDHEIYVRDPRKLGEGEFFYAFYPLATSDGKEVYFSTYPLEPTPKAADYTLLEPSKTIWAERRMHCSLAPGSYRLGFRVSMTRPHPGDLKKWSQEETDRILPKVWDPKGVRPTIGTLPLKVVDRPLQWYVERLAMGNVLLKDDEQALAKAKNLPPQEQARLLERMKELLAEGIEPSDGYKAIAAMGTPEAIKYLLKTAADAAAKSSPGWEDRDAASSRAVIHIMQAFTECPHEAALPFLKAMASHPHASFHVYAVMGLAAMPRPEFAELFRHFLLDEGDDIGTYDRAYAAMGLARLGDEKAYDLIHQVLLKYGSGNDGGLLRARLVEAYDELTRRLQARQLDYRPPDFVMQDKGAGRARPSGNGSP
jgi:hypothetical protein